MPLVGVYRCYSSMYGVPVVPRSSFFLFIRLFRRYNYYYYYYYCYVHGVPETISRRGIFAGYSASSSSRRWSCRGGGRPAQHVRFVFNFEYFIFIIICFHRFLFFTSSAGRYYYHTVGGGIKPRRIIYIYYWSSLVSRTRLIEFVFRYIDTTSSGQITSPVRETSVRELYGRTGMIKEPLMAFS